MLVITIFKRLHLFSHLHRHSHHMLVYHFPWFSGWYSINNSPLECTLVHRWCIRHWGLHAYPKNPLASPYFTCNWYNTLILFSLFWVIQACPFYSQTYHSEIVNFALFEQLMKEDYVQLRQEAMDLQDYSSAKLDRVTRYLGVLADKTRKLGKMYHFLD